MEFMKVNLERTNVSEPIMQVLVHCMAGVSRSVTIVLAYLIKEKAMGFDQAYALVKNRRRIVHCSHLGRYNPIRGSLLNSNSSKGS
jgi:protein-tyrosine phosphatase